VPGNLIAELLPKTNNGNKNGIEQI